MQELELTYLPKKLPENLKDFPYMDLLDIYIPASVEHPVLRIRKRGNVCEITKKQPLKEGDYSHHHENTIPLTNKEFEELSNLKGKRVQKRRYLYKNDGYVFEIDVFQGDLAGLILIDVEFKTLEEKTAFKMPVWCSVDVTQEKFLAGGMLSGKKYSDIDDKLKKFGYKKIIQP